MNVYQTSFGFRLPYQCLVDGTMIVQAVAHKVPLNESIPRTLTADTKLYVTQCILNELTQLDKEEFGKAVYVARKKLQFRKCGHSPSLPARDCIIDMVGKTNPHRFCVATHDKILRATLRGRPGVPLVHLKQQSVMVLEPPSQATLSAATKVEREKMLPATGELKALASFAVEGAAAEVVAVKKKKRKGPAAPNPLSCLKSKKTKTDVSIVAVEQQAEEPGKKKRRHRSRRREETVEPVVGDDADDSAADAASSLDSKDKPTGKLKRRKTKRHTNVDNQRQATV